MVCWSCFIFFVKVWRLVIRDIILNEMVHWYVGIEGKSDGRKMKNVLGRD